MTPELKDFLADLITKQEWASHVLMKLCSCPHGVWVPVSQLCVGIPDAVAFYEPLLGKHDNEISSTWLRHPFQQDDLILVVFYFDDEMSSAISLVNIEYLRQVLPSLSFLA